MAKDKKDASVLSSKTKENKLRKLAKHVKTFPKDASAKEQLEALKSNKAQVSVRKKSQNKGGWVNSMLSNSKLNSNALNAIKAKMRPELRKKGLMDMAKMLKTQSSL